MGEQRGRREVERTQSFATSMNPWPRPCPTYATESAAWCGSARYCTRVTPPTQPEGWRCTVTPPTTAVAGPDSTPLPLGLAGEVGSAPRAEGEPRVARAGV